MIEEVFEMDPEGSVLPSSPAWSPDNKKIAYLCVDGPYIGIPWVGDGQIWLRDLTTMNDTPILIDVDEYGYAMGQGGIDFSPDGKQIVCVLEGTKRPMIPQVWRMDIGGENKVHLTNFEEYRYVLSPKWVPDGKKILLAFAGGTIHLINPDGSGYIEKPTSTKKGGGGNWSSDGKKIVFMSKDNIWIINSDGTNPVQLTTDGNVDRDYIPSWSPKGNKIAYTIYGDEKCPNYIMICNVDGSNPTKLLLSNNLIGTNPVWSKDGKRLLIVGLKDITPPLSKTTYYTAGMYILTLPEEVLK